MSDKTYVVYRSNPYGPIEAFNSIDEAVAFGRENDFGEFEYGKGWHVEIYPKKTAEKLMASYVPGSDGGFRNELFYVSWWGRFLSLLGF